MTSKLRAAVAALLAVLLLTTLAAPIALAAQEAETRIEIRSEADFRAFAGHCALDTWSRGKTVVLKTDLTLQAGDAPVPTFGGTFDGGGYTISGVRLSESGSYQGLFRYVQSGGVVKDLHVFGVVTPGGSRCYVGGIAGSNAGVIQNCTFGGKAEGESCVGGIAGINTVTGEIRSCTATDAVQGTDCTGGIVGRNLGLVLNCTNRCSVNTVSAGDAVSLEDLESLDVDAALNQLTESRSERTEEMTVAGSTDTGGIAGYSSGLIQSCVNTGSVGYLHAGYNVGGIAGRQTGYLSGCVNSGTVYGRKDVGGMIGQAEPDIIVTSDRDSLENLRTELDRLDGMIQQALNHTDTSAQTISDRLGAVGACTDAARDSSKDLLDQTQSAVDGNIGSINSLSASIVDSLDQMAPAMDDLADSADTLAELSEQLEVALEQLAKAGDTAGSMMKKLQSSVDALQAASRSMQSAADKLKEALQLLKEAVSIQESAPGEVKDALRRLNSGISDLGDALGAAGTALQTIRTEVAANPGWSDLLRDQAFLNALGTLADSLTTMNAALDQVTSALNVILSDVSIDWAKASAALEKASDAMSDLSDAAAKASDAMSDLSAALGYGKTLSGQLGDAFHQLEKVTASAASAGRSLRGAFDTIGTVMRKLAKDGPVKLTPLGDRFRKTGDELYASLSDLSGQMDALNQEVLASGKTMTADLRAISSQANRVLGLMIDMMERLQSGGNRDTKRLEDTSEEDIAATRQGKAANSRNSGIVGGDRNVGGIIGTMSIEYDLDPENDDTSLLTSTYETKAVLENCRNTGAVTGKKDGIGGLVGRMDLGTMLACENYGDVASTNGSYVGGAAGYSDASIRACYSKCTLSGRNQIGGIAGHGKTVRNCCAIVRITEGEECLGAIAGEAELSGVSGNAFLDTGLAGIDGISYAGAAEPVEFAALQAIEGVPAGFLSFTLTLRADDAVIASVPFSYGEDLTQVKLPEVPEKEGCYGAWPEFDPSGISSDLTLDAVYLPWVTMAASQETSDGLSLALAEGRFTEAAALHVTENRTLPLPSALKSDGETTLWDITLSNSEVTEEDSVLLRLLCRDGGTVWQYRNGAWEQLPAKQNGQYLLVTMSGTTGTFCILPGGENGVLWWSLSAAALAAAAGGFVLLRKRKKARRKPTAVS